MITLTVPGIPRPAGSKRVVHNRSTGKAYVVDACAKSRDWKTTVAQVARDTYTGDIIRTPVRLSIIFCLARPKGHYRLDGRTLRTSAPRWPTVKPDITKLVRAVEDALTGIIWYDDSQIVIQIAGKVYQDSGSGYCTHIIIEEVN